MKKMYVLTFKNIREMVRIINDHNKDNPDNLIQKEDIVNIIKDDYQYYLIYFN